MTITVTLTENELSICRMLGNMRSMLARNASVKDRRVGYKPAIEMDEDGVVGEYAFCKHFNIFFNPAFELRSGGSDCIYKGQRIDVKTTRYPNGKIAASLKQTENKEVDVYVLAIMSEHIVKIVGWIKYDELIRPENIKSFGYGDCYMMAQESLHAWKNHD